MPSLISSSSISKYPNQFKVTYHLHLLLLPKIHHLLPLAILNYLLLHLTLNNHSHRHKMTNNPHHHQPQTINPNLPQPMIANLNLHLPMTNKTKNLLNTHLANPLATPHLHPLHLFSVALAPLLALHSTTLTALPHTPPLPMHILNLDPTHSLNN